MGPVKSGSIIRSYFLEISTNQGGSIKRRELLTEVYCIRLPNQQWSEKQHCDRLSNAFI